MPAKQILRVALTEPFVRSMRGKGTEGTSPSASDVVRIALAKLIKRERGEAIEMTSLILGAGQPFRG